MKVPGIKYLQGCNAYSDPDGHKYGVAIHNTSNNATAQKEADYATHRTDGISSHFYVDDREIIQSLDTRSKAGHAGSTQGNDNAIAFEITGFDTNSRDWWLNNVAWEEIGMVIAYLKQHDSDFSGLIIARASVSEMQSNPHVRKLYAHDDMRRAWGGTSHTDPGPNFPWDRLFGAINDALSPAPSPEDYEGDQMFLLQVAGDDNLWKCTGSERALFNGPDAPCNTFRSYKPSGASKEVFQIVRYTTDDLNAMGMTTVEALDHVGGKVADTTSGDSGTSITSEDVRKVVREELNKTTLAG